MNYQGTDDYNNMGADNKGNHPALEPRVQELHMSHVATSAYEGDRVICTQSVNPPIVSSLPSKRQTQELKEKTANIKKTIQEVSRDSPQVGKTYVTARFTETIGDFYSKSNPQRWFTTHDLIYVGTYLRHEQKGYGEGCDSRYIFQLQGPYSEGSKCPYVFQGPNCDEVTVQVDTEDFTTCFREVNPIM